jgi:predicted dehydrogenase
MGMKMGKHAHVQKPLTKSIYEARYLGKLAAEKNLATQMGNQGTASSDLREAAAIIKSGVVGTVKEVHVWTNRPVWDQGIDRPSDTPEVPASLHWSEWIGPAEMRPYHPAYHPFKWRGWWAFGTGALGDMACHTLNMPYMALDLRDPVSVQATTSGHNMETFPAWSVIEESTGIELCSSRSESGAPVNSRTVSPAANVHTPGDGWATSQRCARATTSP